MAGESRGGKKVPVGLDLEVIPHRSGEVVVWLLVRSLEITAFKLNRKVKQQAVAMALSARFQEGNLIVLNDFTLERMKTKDFVGVMDVLDVANGLIVTDSASENLTKSSSNVHGYKVLSAEGLNVYDILLHKKLILVQPVIESLEKRLMA